MGFAFVGDDDDAAIVAGAITMLRQMQPELLPEDLMQFAMSIEDLNLAVDMLVFFESKRGWSDMLDEFLHRPRAQRQDPDEPAGIGLGKIMDVVRFLTAQGLLVRLKQTVRAGHVHGGRDSVLKAAPRAVDELVFRLAHDGQPSAKPKQPSFEDKAQQARDEVNAALISAGYRTSDKGRRLRVVR
jgi:hypothetical protein